MQEGQEARGAVRVRDLRRSECVKDHSRETYTGEEEFEEEEEVLNSSSYQSISTTPQSSSTQQSNTQQLLSQQSAISPISIDSLDSREIIRS